jgi:hypothetical protein
MEEKMENKRLLLGMLAVVLAFGMTITGCGDSGDGGTGGPEWIPATGENAYPPMDGTLSKNDTELFIADMGDDANPGVTFTKKGTAGSSLDGIWEGDDDDFRITISGNNWILAIAYSGGKNYEDVLKGTFTRNGSTITFITTHVMDYGEDSKGSGTEADPISPPGKN